MFRSLWIAKTGLNAQQTQLDAISHNLANVSTTGFKRSHAQFEDLLYQNIRQAGGQTTQQTTLPTGLQLGTGVRPVATSRIFTQGGLQESGNPLDMAISGNGFFPLALPDGSTGYTRDGSFRVDGQGQVVNANGYPISPPMVVPADTEKITVGKDGTVTAIVIGNPVPVQLGQVQLAVFANPAGLDPKGQNMYAETGASGNPVIATPGLIGAGTINQGFVETSNVNVVEELVAMIQTQRAYEINSKAISTSDQMLARLSQL
ncbi:MAG: flagellar basal-body rod protein FlgG [Burkholderiaceae bacterium]